MTSRVSSGDSVRVPSDFLTVPNDVVLLFLIIEEILFGLDSGAKPSQNSLNLMFLV